MHIAEFLQANGYKAANCRHGSAWYLSPFRKESQPSFKVHINRNVWFDFGTGEGGNIVSFFMKLYQVDRPRALELIKDYAEMHAPLPPVKDSEESSSIKIYRVIKLGNPALVQYLQSRKVSLFFSAMFLHEVYYMVHYNRFFALGFKNDHGGYELRNAIYKSSSSPKWITTIPNPDTSKVNVFEGFMDFLSWCTHYNQLPRVHTIVLNSLAFLPRIEFILSSAKEVNLFLDNDPAGRKATEKIISSCHNVKDWAPVIYPRHKDFNEFLMNKEPSKETS